MNQPVVPALSARAPTARFLQLQLALLPGLALTATLAALATAASRIAWLQANGVSVLTLAIVLGMLVGNTASAPPGAATERGVGYAKQTLLRLGIVLYGLRLTFADIAHVGGAGVLIDAVVLSSTFVLSWWAGTRLFHLDRNTALLIGAGSAICGAAAVMAAEPVVRGRTEQVTVAVATVVVFGTLALFLYPALYHLNERLHLIALSPGAYGLFAGSTIHEVAQVVAAGRAVSVAAADTAVITKMVRVMMLAPFLIGLSACLSRRPDRRGIARPAARRPLVIPWFAFGFAAVTALHSLVHLPAAAAAGLMTFDTFILAMAMAALGYTTRWSAIRAAGMRPLGLAALLFLWLVAGGGLINALVSRWLV